MNLANGDGYEMNIAQLKASNPSYSVWVSASAGTGKTKILTDRVIKLLLSGVNPSKILCLTFTNAAASEMLTRINRELKIFAKSSKKELLLSLESLFGRPPKNQELDLAKRLFHTLLHLDQRLQIQTIHGFCQGVLRTFPFEAGIKPGFTVIDDLQAKDALKKSSEIITSQVTSQVAQDKTHESNSLLANALQFLAVNVHDTTLDDLMIEIVNSKVQFKILLDNFTDSQMYEMHLKSLMKVQDNKDEVLKKFKNSTARWDAKVNRVLDIQKTENSSIFFEKLKTQFLTNTGDLRSRIISAKLSKENPGLVEELQSIQIEVRDIDQTLKALSIIEASKAMFILAENIIAAYEKYKSKFGYIDYDDLIYLAQKLLSSSEFRDWVRYKLDGSLEHILVDEAQDTSPEQWRIIESLMQEFYAGADDKLRTVFVVGDEKQSIYSFQGADLRAFKGMNEYLHIQMQNATKEYCVIDLELGYRSTKAVMDIVAHVFQKLQGELFPLSKVIECFRAPDPGKVELWPVIQGDAKEDIFWPIPGGTEEPQQAYAKLATKIALYIKTQIDNGVLLPSTGHPVTPGDVMILVRRRNQFTSALIQALHDASIDVCGIDRLELASNLAVLDLISLAKFVLQPLDDLNLASLLKSPFIGMSENDLRLLLCGEMRIANKNTKKEALYNKITKSHIRDILSSFKQIHLAYSLQDFFLVILDVLGHRKRLLEESGNETEDAINEFLALANNFAAKTSTSLQEFVLWFERNHIEIKRDVENSNKIRIMTIHAAKGLQAPMVILADTISTPISQDKILWTEDGIPIWTGGAKNSNDFIKSSTDAKKTRDYQEYLRLLYVAMTRSEDHLIIAGYSETAKIPDGCWYNVVAESILALNPYPDDVNHHIYETPGEITNSNKVNSEISSPPPAPSPALAPLLLKPEIDSGIDPEPQLNQENLFDTQDGVIYGQVFHKILEDIVRTREVRILTSHPMLKLLPLPQSKSISYKIEKLLEMPEFQAILEMEVFTEVSVRDKTQIGRIDLLGISSDKAIIIDYKTDKGPHTEMPQQYKMQLMFYKSAVQKIYPDHKIEAKVLWLEDLSFHSL
ncbi:MAG: UvrD-helicase domain-containing protein [Pseudomonadota bacterium]